MDKAGIGIEVKQIVAEIIEMNPEQIDGDAHLVDDLGMDSMMALEILAALEKRFKIKLPEEELPKLISVNSAVEVAQKYVS